MPYGRHQERCRRLGEDDRLRLAGGRVALVWRVGSSQLIEDRVEAGERHLRVIARAGAAEELLQHEGWIAAWCSMGEVETDVEIAGHQKWHRALDTFYLDVDADPGQVVLDQ
jgi:hypothetical protein